MEKYLELHNKFMATCYRILDATPKDYDLVSRYLRVCEIRITYHKDIMDEEQYHNCRELERIITELTDMINKLNSIKSSVL